MVSVNVLWRRSLIPFLRRVAVLWTGLGAAALAMAVLRPARARVKALSMVAVACVAISGAAQVNQHFGAYPTLRSALGLKLASQVDFSQVSGPTSALTVAQPALPLSQSWLPPQTMPSTGIVSTVTIPGLVSGFAAREAWIYLPPAYLSVSRAQLPVLVLVPGQPGTPRDWFDGGWLDAVLDSYASAHAGSRYDRRGGRPARQPARSDDLRGFGGRQRVHLPVGRCTHLDPLHVAGRPRPPAAGP
nr:hypothetical protein [Rhodococcus sp. EPR-157]